MTVSTEFETTPGGLVLSNAILLYQAKSQAPRKDAPAFASIHAVEHASGQPVIGAGSPVTRAHLRRWTEALGKTAAPEILPENVMVAHPDVLAWWIPAHVRKAYFHLAQPPKGLRLLSVESARTTVSVPYPAHLLIATRKGLGVYALPQSTRPTAETAVLHSPILNVFLDGALCWGNIARPKALAVASMAEFESAVFDSWSTHPNVGQDLSITGKGGLVRLWDDLAAREAKHFPVGRLKPFHPAMRRPAKVDPVTLSQLITKAAK